MSRHFQPMTFLGKQCESRHAFYAFQQNFYPGYIKSILLDFLFNHDRRSKSQNAALENSVTVDENQTSSTALSRYRGSVINKY